MARNFDCECQVYSWKFSDCSELFQFHFWLGRSNSKFERNRRAFPNLFWMEPTVTVIDTLKGLSKASRDFVSGIVHRRESSSRNNPIEILKRLQREAFSDLMRLRDRQDKIERLLSMYKASNKGPFEESGTHVRGEVDVSGAILKMDAVDQQNFDALRRAGIRTGVDTRFTFETNIRNRDYFAAELMASQKAGEDLIDFSGNPPLSLAKVFYKANITDWFSAVAIPIGAHCRDIGSDAISLHQVEIIGLFPGIRHI